MTEENSPSREDTRELGKFIRRFFEDTYLQEKQKSEKRQADQDAIINKLKPWWDRTKGKDLLSAKGLYYLYQLDSNTQEVWYRYLLSMMVVLAQALEGITRNITSEDKKELAKHLEQLTMKAEEERQNIDKHIAKRLGELFSKGDEGYIG
jgi:hypothetical protein